MGPFKQLVTILISIPGKDVYIYLCYSYEEKMFILSYYADHFGIFLQLRNNI